MLCNFDTVCPEMRIRKFKAVFGSCIHWHKSNSWWHQSINVFAACKEVSKLPISRLDLCQPMLGYKVWQFSLRGTPLADGKLEI